MPDEPRLGTVDRLHGLLVSLLQRQADHERADGERYAELSSRLATVESMHATLSLSSGEVSGIRERDVGQEHRIAALEQAQKKDDTGARLDQVERVAAKAAMLGPLSVAIVVLLRTLGLL